MFQKEIEEIKPLLIEYVNRSSCIKCLQWDPNVTHLRKLPVQPYAESYNQRKQIAHYFLLVASITETELIRRAENARELMIDIYRFMNKNHRDCFNEDQEESFREVIRKTGVYNYLGNSQEQISRVLASVNQFVQGVAKGDLLEYANSFSKPQDLVESIEDNIPRMGGQYVEKAWMYMRWMTRPYPDLRVYTNFSPENLYVPMTSSVRDVAYCLGLCSEPTADWWNDSVKVEQARKRLTTFAKELFPDDPVKVDYPFYMLGRWMRGNVLSSRLLLNYLRFWEQIWSETHITPISFDIISKNESTLEKEVRENLERFDFLFSFEPWNFVLDEDDGAPTYTADFVLPQCKINGKTVILEPHGVWTPRKRRTVGYRRSKFTIWVLPTIIDQDEVEFIHKLRQFRTSRWSEMYYLVLIVPPQYIDRVTSDYPNIADKIWDVKNMPGLLFDLKNKHCRS